MESGAFQMEAQKPFAKWDSFPFPFGFPVDPQFPSVLFWPQGQLVNIVTMCFWDNIMSKKRYF